MNYRKMIFLLAIFLVFGLQSLHSQKNSTVSLDSIVRYDATDNVKSKVHYRYDIEGNLINETLFLPDEQYEGWRGEKQYLFEYDYRGNLTNYIVKSWNFNTYTWMNYTKSEYVFDSDDNLLEKTDFEWSKFAEEWFPVTKDVFEYNNDKKRTGSISYKWDTEWIPDTKYEFVFNNKNIEEKAFYQYAQDNTWQIRMRYVYSFDEKDRAETEKAYYNFGGKEVFQYLSEYTYDENGNISEENKMKYLSSEDSLINYNNFVYVYDENNNLLMKHGKQWNSKDNRWEYLNQDINYYDENGDLTTEEYYDLYDYENNKWIPSFKTEYEIEYNDNHVELFMPPNLKYSNKITSSNDYRWNKDISEWELIDKRAYFYNDYVTSVRDKEQNIKLYPNPAESEIWISGIEEPASLKIYNMAGELLLSQTVYPDAHIEIGNYEAGAYIWKLNLNGLDFTGKFIKE
jgi:hypothetical protein